MVLAVLCCMPALLQATVTVDATGTNVSCYGGNNGTATATAIGGWAPYTYHWSNGATTQTITGLTAGTYFVTVTDIDLGFGVGSITITQPPQLGVTAYGQSQICGIVPDGSATAVPFGGVPPYAYHWSNGGTTAQITGLTGGTYYVTVTDLNGCTAVANAIVYFYNEGIWIMDSTVQVKCYGANNGFTHVSGMSGTPPYTYHWSANAGNSTSQNLYNLAPGLYTVTVTDANGCSNLHNVTITQPTPIVLSTSTVAGVCGLAGSATVTALGGIQPYSYHWNTGSTSATLSAPAGTYSVTVTDANICPATATATITVAPVTLNINISILSNAGCTTGGSASATISGGSGNYAYTWSSVPAQITATATNLPAANYTVTVVDITTGCSKTATAIVPSSPSLTAAATVITNATCLTGGSATATATGGTPPFSYVWDNNPALNTQTVSGLGAGPHTVKITDSKGCIATSTVTIGQNQGPTVSIQVTNNATCLTGGSATANATSGTAPYNYIWSANAGNATTKTVTGLSAGTYTVTVTDAGGCAASATATVTQTGAPTVVISSSSSGNCTSGGSATAGGSGGTAPYTYKWNNPAMSTTPTVASLSPGTYTVTITDANGCTSTAAVSIASPLLPTVVITASTNANCNQPGSATAIAAGGVGTYTYHWDSGENTAAAVNLNAGIHTVTATDANGCTATASVTIGSSNNGIKIGDYVWYDNSQDGFQDLLETNGVNNITVKLIKPGPDGLFGTADDVTVQTTTTNAAGYYQFTCVTPGTYILMFTGIPSGYQWSPKDNVNNDCLDSDVKSNGKTDAFTITAGQGDNLCFDAGIHQLCDNVLYPGIVCCDQTICEGEMPMAFYQVQPPTGGSGQLQYQWVQLVQMGPAGPQWVGIPGATNATYQPGALFETAYFMRCVKRQGCANFLESNVIKITVLPSGTPGCQSFIMNLVVKPHEPGAVEIQWTTHTEDTQYLYTVEHSTNQTDWHNVSSVMSKNVNNPSNDYSALHETPAIGVNYYRIKRSSLNGNPVYSEIRSIEFNLTADESIAVYPNPTQGNLHVKIMSDYNNDVKVAVMTTDGKLVHTMTQVQGVNGQFDVPLENFPEGIYFVRINYGKNSVKTFKIAKYTEY